MDNQVEFQINFLAKLDSLEKLMSGFDKAAQKVENLNKAIDENAVTPTGKFSSSNRSLNELNETYGRLKHLYMNASDSQSMQACADMIINLDWDTTASQEEKRKPTLGSICAARSKTQQYVELAKKTPLELPEAMENGNKLQAVANNVSSNAELKASTAGITAMKSKDYFGMIANQTDTTARKMANLQDGIFHLEMASGERLNPAVRSSAGIENLPAQKIAAEKPELNFFIDKLIAVNEEPDERQKWIDERNRKYSELLKNINVEKEGQEENYTQTKEIYPLAFSTYGNINEFTEEDRGKEPLMQGKTDYEKINLVNPSGKDYEQGKRRLTDAYYSAIKTAQNSIDDPFPGIGASSGEAFENDNGSIFSGSKTLKNFNTVITDSLIKQVDNHFGNTGENYEDASSFMKQLSNTLQMVLNDVNYTTA